MVILAVAGLAAAFAVPVSAGTTRYAYACEEHWAYQLQDSTFTIDDGVLLARGGALVYEVTGDDLCRGTITIYYSFNLDLTDWSGVLWGTAVTELDAFDGGFVQSWTAHWIVDDPLNAPTDIWDGRYLGHGYGELAGWQARGTVHEATHILVIDEGFAFEPGS